MATLVLGTVGSIFGGPIGGFIGSAIGSMIDNELFPQKQQGPRLTDLSVQTSTYGNSIPFMVGPENRAAGNVIWSSGLIETVHQKSSKGGKGGPSVETTSYTYAASFAVALCDCSKRGPIKGVEKIWANKKIVYDATGSTTPESAGLWSSLAVYLGDFTQTPDPTIEAKLGVGEVPGYRGTAYIVIENFQLADYGNRLPMLEILVRADDEMTFGGAVAKIITICGFDPNTVSVGLLSGDLRGFMIGTASSGTAAIQPLALVGDFDTAQVGGGLRFQPRATPPFSSIALDDLSGHAFGQDRPSPLKWTRSPETSLPREASVSFPDPDRDYQVNSQTARRQTGSSQNNLSQQVAIVMDTDTGRKTADRLLWEAWTARVTAEASTDDRWRMIEAGKSYCVPTPAGLESLRLKAKRRGANGVVELELARDQAAVYESTAAGIAAGVPVQTVNVPGPSTIMLLDMPILQDGDDDTGFYFMVDGVSDGWRGANVVRSQDGGLTYDQLAPVGFESMLGTIDALATGPTAIFDTTNVVRVTLDDDGDELESVTELDVLNGKNVCWIGGDDGADGEVLQYTTATLVAPGVYDISGLLRGRFGTEFAVGTHAAGERFVSLELGPINRIDFTAADWNKTRDYKAVSLLTAEADAVPVDFTNTGEGKRPLSPVHIVGDTSSGDLVVTWLRRSRYRSPGLGGGPLALGETSESYEIDVYRGVTFKRTLTATTATVTYTAALQATDGFAPGDIVTLEVYQISDVRGRGRPGHAELNL